MCALNIHDFYSILKHISSPLGDDILCFSRPGKWETLHFNRAFHAQKRPKFCVI